MVYRFAIRREPTGSPDAMYSVTTANRIRRCLSSNVTATPLESRISARGVKPASNSQKLAVRTALRQARGMKPTVALLPFLLMVMAIMTVPTLVLDEQGLPRYRLLRGELQELRGSNEELVQKIAQLKAEIESLRFDTNYVERIARDELGMVRPEEFVFQFPSQ